MKVTYYLFVYLLLFSMGTILCMESEIKEAEKNSTLKRRHSLTSTYDGYTPFASPIAQKNQYDKDFSLKIPIVSHKLSVTLLNAARNNRTQEVKISLEQRADPNIPILNTNKTPIHFAVEHNNDTMVKYLIVGKAHIFIQEKDGSYPLSLMERQFLPNQQNTQLDILQQFTRAIIDQRLINEYAQFIRYSLQLADNYIPYDEVTLENSKIIMHIKIIKIINYYLRTFKKEEYIPTLGTLFSSDSEELIKKNITLANGLIIPTCVTKNINSILELYNKDKNHPKIQLYESLSNPDESHKKTEKKIKKITNNYNLLLKQEKSSQPLKKAYSSEIY